MAHARTTLLTALVAAIAAAGTDADARVFNERAQAIAADEYPFIIAKFSDESQSRTAQGNGRPGSFITRTATLVVYHTQKQAAGYIAAGDTAIGLVETALAYAAIAGLHDIVPIKTLFDEEQEGELPLYTVTQEFSVTYNTTQGNPADFR